MPTTVGSGTQAATIGTEHTLLTDTTNHDYVLVTDLAAMTNGDAVELRIYSIVLSGGTERLAYVRRFVNVQFEPIKYSVPVPADISFRATLTQTAGVGRSFPWKVVTP